MQAFQSSIDHSRRPSRRRGEAAAEGGGRPRERGPFMPGRPASPPPSGRRLPAPAHEPRVLGAARRRGPVGQHHGRGGARAEGERRRGHRGR